MEIGYVDIDSMIFKIKNMKNEECQNIQKNNPDIFGCKIGLMEDEIDKNDEIIEYIGLFSKCYSYITKNINNSIKIKGISESYKSKYLNHQEFRNVLFDNKKLDKVEFNTISIKNQKIFTDETIKDNIKNFNDKRYMGDKFTSIPFELNVYIMTLFYFIIYTFILFYHLYFYFIYYLYLYYNIYFKILLIFVAIIYLIINNTLLYSKIHG